MEAESTSKKTAAHFSVSRRLSFPGKILIQAARYFHIELNFATWKYPNLLHKIPDNLWIVFFQKEYLICSFFSCHPFFSFLHPFGNQFLNFYGSFRQTLHFLSVLILNISELLSGYLPSPVSLIHLGLPILQSFYRILACGLLCFESSKLAIQTCFK